MRQHAKKTSSSPSESVVLWTAPTKLGFGMFMSASHFESSELAFDKIDRNQISIYKQSLSAENKSMRIVQALKEIEGECSVADWDGYGGVPVSREIILAAEQLLKNLPDWAALPDIFPEPDGSIGIDWIQSKTNKVLVSIISTDRLAYVCRYENLPVDKGELQFSKSLPDRIMFVLHRYFA